MYPADVPCWAVPIMDLLWALVSGWSDVGLSLGHSLGSELDQLMHNTVAKLMGTLTTIIQVESDIDHVLAAAAHHTDKHISVLKKSALWRHKSDAKAALSENSDSEISSLLQSTVEVCDDKGVDDELASLLQGRVHMQVAMSRKYFQGFARHFHAFGWM